MAAASSEIAAGTILQGRYSLQAKLGEHAGEVFTAKRASDGRIVVVRRWRAPTPQAASAFLERARAALAVRHPVLAAVEACGQEADRSCFIVSEHVQGRPLDAWADKVGIPSFANVIEVGRTLCAGLLAAQQGGLTHDALHPRNVVIAQRVEGPAQRVQVKLLDLGVPAFVRPRVPRALAAQFMAPEQLAALLGTNDGAGSAADGTMNVYSLGCLLYYLCTGGAPFPGNGIDELREAHAAGKLVPAARINPKLPVALDALITRALAIAPRERFQSIAELSDAFAVLDLSSGSGVRPVSLPPPPSDGDLSGLTFEETPTLTTSRPPRARTETPIIDVSEFAELLGVAAAERPPQLREGEGVSQLPRAPSLPARTKPPERARNAGWRWSLLVVVCAAAALAVLVPAPLSKESRAPVASPTTTVRVVHAPEAPPAIPAPVAAPAVAPVAARRPEVSVVAPPAAPPPPAGHEPSQELGRDEPSAHAERAPGKARIREHVPAANDGKPVLEVTPREETDQETSPRSDAATATPAAAPVLPELPTPYDAPAPVPPAAAPATSPAPRETTRPRATGVAMARIADLEVHGSLPTALVRRAIERIRAQLAACYARAAQVQPRDALGVLHVELEIDEAARARNVRVSGGTVAGLNRCVADAASSVVSTRAPDTGTVKATWKVVFEP